MLLLIDLPLGRTVWGRMGTASLWIAVSASPVMLWATRPWGDSWGGWTQVWSGDLGKTMGLQWLKTNESTPLKDPLVLLQRMVKIKMFVSWVACLGVRADIISKVTSQKALCHIVVLPASQPPLAPPCQGWKIIFPNKVILCRTRLTARRACRTDVLRAEFSLCLYTSVLHLGDGREKRPQHMHK